MLDSWIAGGGVHCHTNDQPVLLEPLEVPSMDARGLVVAALVLLIAGWLLSWSHESTRSLPAGLRR